MSRKRKPDKKPPMRVIVREDQSGWAPPGPGHPSYRAWLYSGDEFGRVFNGGSGQGAMAVKETRSYAPSATEDFNDRETFKIVYNARLAKLTDDEREVLRLQRKTEQQRTEVVIAAGDLVAYQRMGYALQPGSSHIVERRGLPPLECVKVTATIEIEIEHASPDEYGMRLEGDEATPERRYSYSDIAEKMGITTERVHSLVKSAMRKMRARP